MSSDDFLKELTLQFDRILRIKDSLQTKANNTIAMSGSVTALLVGFTVFLLKDFQAKTEFFLYFGIVALIIEIIVTSSAINHAMRAYRMREYYYPLSYEAFFEKNNPNFDVIEQFKNASKDDFNHHFIKEYLIGIRQNQQAVNDVATNIERAQKTYLYSIVIIPFFVTMIVLSKFVML